MRDNLHACDKPSVLEFPLVSKEQWIDLALVLGIGMYAMIKLARAALDDAAEVDPLNTLVWLVSTYFILKGASMLVLAWLAD
jgi:hypothetical protein